MTMKPDSFGEQDVYYCEDCKNYLNKKDRYKHNRCKAKVVMGDQAVKINSLRICKSFKER